MSRLGHILAILLCVFSLSAVSIFAPSGVSSVKAATTWATEADRVIADAEQHVGQGPYGYADGGWKKSVDTSGGTPVGQQLMDAEPPFMPTGSGWTAGIDCVGLVYVVFTETGHGNQGPYSKIVDIRRDVPGMYGNYQNKRLPSVTFDGTFLDRPTSYINDSNVQKGDIVIFKDPPPAPASGTYLEHVGIYVGGGRMVNMTSSKVLDVKVTNIFKSLNPDVPYYVAAVIHTHLTTMTPRSSSIPPAPLGHVTTDIVFDATGDFTSDTTGMTYHPITPSRVMDTRPGTYHKGTATTFKSKIKQTFKVAGVGVVPVVPANATAVTGNIAVVNQTAAGNVTVAPGGTLTSGISPPTSTINFPLGDVRANGVTMGLGLSGNPDGPSATGALDFMYVAYVPGATVDIVFDITGYFTPDTTGMTYHPITPSRVMDTRPGMYHKGTATIFQSKIKQTFQVRGVGGVPANATAVTGNIAVVNQNAAGNVTVAPGGTLTSGISPLTSTINFPLADIRASSVTMGLSAGALDFMYWAPGSC